MTTGEFARGARALAARPFAHPHEAAAAPPSRWWRIGEAAITGAILLVVLWSVTDSIQGAGWVEEMPDLWLTALAGLLIAAVLTPVRLPGLLLAVGGLVVGVVVVLAQVLTVDSMGGQLLFFARFEDLWFRLEDWFSQAFNSGITTDSLPFVLFVVGVVWMAAFWGSLCALRRRSPWLLLLLFGILLAINVSYLRGRQWDANFAVFLGGSALLVMRMHLLRRMTEWRRMGTEFPPSLSRYTLIATIVLTAALVGVTRAAPRPDRSAALTGLWDAVAQPFEGLGDDFARVFNGIDGKRGTAIHSFGAGVALQGDISPGAAVVARVEAEGPGLLRGAAYDRYTTRGWLQSEIVRTPVPEGEGIAPPSADPAGDQPYRDRREVTTQLSVARSPKILFSVGQPVAIDRSVNVDQTVASTVRVEVADPAQPGIPANLVAAAREIAQNQIPLETGLVIAAQDRVPVVPEGYQVVTYERGAEGVTAITVSSAPPAPDVLALRPPGKVRPGATYEVTGSVSTASEEALRSAGADYPLWVTQGALQLPRELSDADFARLRSLAERVTAGAAIPYDQAAALEQFLCCTARRDAEGNLVLDEDGNVVLLYPCDLSIDVSPPNTDAVSWFLFDNLDAQGLPVGGYFDYHASAMAVLLRTLGIPARIGSGYLLTEDNYDARSDRFIVRGRHAYTWVEVFFPEYGWVDFDPTPIPTPLPFTLTSGRSGAERSLTLSSDIFEGSSTPFTESFSLLSEAQLAQLSGRADRQGGTIAGVGTPLFLALLAAAGGILFAAGGGRLAWEWSLRGLGPVERSWVSFLRLSRWSGLSVDPARTPAEHAAAIGGALQDEANPRLLADHFARLRYGRPLPPGMAEGQARQAWRALRGRLLRRLLRSRLPGRLGWRRPP